MIPSLPTFTPRKGIQDSLELWIPHRVFRILGRWNLDSEFQSLVGFQIPWAVMRIPKHRMRIPRAKLSRVPLHDATECSRTLLLSLRSKKFHHIQWNLRSHEVISDCVGPHKRLQKNYAKKDTNLMWLRDAVVLSAYNWPAHHWVLSSSVVRASD